MQHDTNYGDTAILVQGHTLKAMNIFNQLKNLGKEERYEEFKNREWMNIVIGNFKTGEMGRATTGFWLALVHDSPKLIFGTGASCMIEKTGEILSRQEWNNHGQPKVIWESEYTLNWLIKNFDKLEAFPELWKTILTKFPGNPREAIKRLFMISSTDSVSFNTATEVEEALKICYKLPFMNGIIRVTNPSHLPRCLSNAQTELRTFELESVVYGSKRFVIYGHASTTDFKSNVDPIVIFEPMSGGIIEKELDDNFLYANRILNGFWKLPADKQQEFLHMSQKFFSK